MWSYFANKNCDQEKFKFVLVYLSTLVKLKFNRFQCHEQMLKQILLKYRKGKFFQSV